VGAFLRIKLLFAHDIFQNKNGRKNSFYEYLSDNIRPKILQKRFIFESFKLKKIDFIFITRFFNHEASL